MSLSTSSVASRVHGGRAGSSADPRRKGLQAGCFLKFQPA